MSTFLEEVKPWYLSKTVWFNVLALLVMVASSFGYGGELPEGWEKGGEFVIVMVNLFLRFVTKTPVMLKK